MPKETKQSKEEVSEVVHAETESIQSNATEAQAEQAETGTQRRARLNNTEFFPVTSWVLVVVIDC